MPEQVVIGLGWAIVWSLYITVFVALVVAAVAIWSWWKGRK